MKPDIHPDYREVIFYDVSNSHKWLTRSTVKTEKTIEHEGKEYPMVELDVTSASHPFFTGSQKFVDTEGRIDRFMKKYGKPGGAGADGENAAEEGADAKAAEEAAAAKAAEEAAAAKAAEEAAAAKAAEEAAAAKAAEEAAAAKAAEEGADSKADEEAAAAKAAEEAAAAKAAEEAAAAKAAEESAAAEASAEEKPAEEAEAPKVEKPDAAAYDAVLAKFEGESTKLDERLGVLYSEAPSNADELTKISGVGPKLSEKLNEFGVYRFIQIANWNQYNIQEFNEQLSFPGRIEREDWIAQATKLAAGEDA